MKRIQPGNKRGFSLIDVMISIAVLATGMLALAALQASLVRATSETRTRTQAVAFAEGILGALRARADADVNVYRGLTTANWKTTINDAAITEPMTGVNAGTSVESMTVTTTVERFVLTDTPASCPGNVAPCFIAQATNPDNEPEYKLVTAQVGWLDSTGAQHTIALRDLLSSLPSSNSAEVVNHDLAGTNVNAPGPAVRIPLPTDVGVIPIAIGDGRETAATNPKPVVDTRSGTPTTRFDVLTYRVEGSSAQVQRKIENQVVGCECRLGPPSVSDPTATFFTKGTRPTFWNGQRYAVPRFNDDPTNPVSVPASWGVSTASQSSLCNDCCRDHHDTTVSPKFSPYKTDHIHYAIVNGAVDFSRVAGSSSPVYGEACRFVRVDGIWRVGADFYLEQMNLLRTTPDANGVQAKNPAPETVARSNYENFAKQLLNARANPPVAATPLSPTQVAALEQSNGLNAPAKILISPLSVDNRFLHDRGLYFDYLEEPARNFITSQLSPDNCSLSDRLLCILPFLPFVSINTTEIAAFGPTPNADHIFVTGSPGLVQNFDPRRGTFTVDPQPGGRVNPQAGGTTQHPDGTTSSARAEMSRSNRGLLALSFPGAGVDPADAGTSTSFPLFKNLADQQLFEFSTAGPRDSDSDGIYDFDDNCPLVPNNDQADSNRDGTGDACGDDDDGDGIFDANDNCPTVENADQADTDFDTGADPDKDGVLGDGIGNVCDNFSDEDGDKVLDGDDNCRVVANDDQLDNNNNGIGDACERDTDSDGVLDHKDNCPADANPNQEDADRDGFGDACDDTLNFTGRIAIQNVNLAVVSPKPRMFWSVNNQVHECQGTTSASDQDPNDFRCINSPRSSSVVFDRYNRVTLGAEINNPCNSGNNGPKKIAPPTCFNYALAGLNKVRGASSFAIDLANATVSGAGQPNEVTSLLVSGLAEGDRLDSSFTLTKSVNLHTSNFYVCTNFVPVYDFTKCE